MRVIDNLPLFGFLIKEDSEIGDGKPDKWRSTYIELREIYITRSQLTFSRLFGSLLSVYRSKQMKTAD